MHFLVVQINDEDDDFDDDDFEYGMKGCNTKVSSIIKLRYFDIYIILSAFKYYAILCFFQKFFVRVF